MLVAERLNGVARMRCSQIREGRLEWHVVLVDAIAELVVRAQIAQPECRSQDVAVATRDGPDLDVDDIVHKTETIRKTVKLTSHRLQSIDRVRNRRAGRNHDVQPHDVILDHVGRSVEAWNACEQY